MEFVDPIAELGPHVAPLGIAFYDKNKFPEKYKNSLFVALHGSWNKYNGKSGYKAIFVKPDDKRRLSLSRRFYHWIGFKMKKTGVGQSHHL